MNYSTSSFIKIVLLYFVVIGFVFLWSGSHREKTIFDNYLIQLEGSSFYYQDPGQTKDFYERILEFKILSETPEEIIFILPDSKKLIANKSLEQNVSSKSEILIKVKNGINKLHHRLHARITDSEIRNSQISEVNKLKYTTTFTITDPSGNKIKFIN